MKKTTKIRVKEGSGNVFADLGFANPESAVDVAILASASRRWCRRRVTRPAEIAVTDQDCLEILVHGVGRDRVEGDAAWLAGPSPDQPARSVTTPPRIELVPKLGMLYHSGVRIIAKRTLRLFWESDRRYGDAKRALEDWHAQVSRANWTNPADVKRHYGDASILKRSRVVFNICGNRYRLVVQINYPYRVVYVRFVGTHAQYDEIDAETV